MSETSSVEREPLATTGPAAIEPVTRYLVTANQSPPLAIRDTQAEAFRLCEDAERKNHPDGADVDFRWYPTDPTVDDAGPEELYAILSGDECTTGYMVTPITIHIGSDA